MSFEKEEIRNVTTEQLVWCPVFEPSFFQLADRLMGTVFSSGSQIFYSSNAAHGMNRISSCREKLSYSNGPQSSARLTTSRIWGRSKWNSRPKLQQVGLISISSGGWVAVKVNRWRREVKKRKSSTRASPSPTQTRFPGSKRDKHDEHQ
ncbi:hypothetical protein JZ751_021337 [Albula glossodonta]|uniref:Uncharacterized protein n=1 Tax=Albula glossodonta TaxID=121402 RepID=A0A8T2NVV0_9TELE|nr:hypothetical protein JZ751_021337 [Albula glossodonta]